MKSIVDNFLWALTVTDIKQKLIQLDKLIEAKETEFLQKQNEVMSFVETKHRAKQTQAYLADILKTEQDINKILIFLVRTRANSKEFKKAADILNRNTMFLKAIVQDTREILTEDLMQRQQAESIDHIKIASLVVGMSVAFATISKMTFDPASAHAKTETLLGAASGLAISFQKNLLQSCKTAGLALCAFPREVKESSTLYYVKEVAKDAVRQLVRPLANERSSSISLGL